MPLSYLTYKLFVEPSVKIGKKIAEGIRDQALEEVEDTPEKLQRELLDLQMSLETEEISEAEYQQKEKDILERLEAVHKKEK